VETAGKAAAAPAFEARQSALLETLRGQFPDAASLKDDPVLQAYAVYYRRFKKTYHVALQLETIACKGKPMPSTAVLVQCMFMAEMQNRLLTAGHDLGVIEAAGGRVHVDVAQGDETYTLLRGTPQTIKASDLFMRDGAGVISSMIYGPDQRTQITPETSAALYTVYAPPGAGAERVRQHLDTIYEYVLLTSPGARVLLQRVA
jgi:DNA/RNA-binding domain of Phe-tRNA-synthetase-like protein